MNRITSFLLSALLLVSCSMPWGKQQDEKRKQRKFTTEVMLRYTPVKDQGRSPLCWAYSMLATIETEHIMMGDSVNLSIDYVTRKLLAEQARCHFL